VKVDHPLHDFTELFSGNRGIVSVKDSRPVLDGQVNDEVLRTHLFHRANFHRLPRLSRQAGFDYDKDNIVVTCTVVDNSARRHISSGICDY